MTNIITYHELSFARTVRILWGYFLKLYWRTQKIIWIREKTSHALRWYDLVFKSIQSSKVNIYSIYLNKNYSWIFFGRSIIISSKILYRKVLWISSQIWNVYRGWLGKNLPQKSDISIHHKVKDFFFKACMDMYTCTHTL